MTMLGRCRHGQRTSSAPVHFGRHLGHLPAKVVAAGPHAHHQHALAHEPVVVAGLVIAAVELAAGEVYPAHSLRELRGLKVAVANHDGVKYPVVSLLVTPGSNAEPPLAPLRWLRFLDQGVHLQHALEIEVLHKAPQVVLHLCVPTVPAA